MGNGKDSVRIDGGTVNSATSIDLGGETTSDNSDKFLANGATFKHNLGITHRNGIVDVGLSQVQVAGALTLQLHSDRSRVGIRKSTVGGDAELDLGGNDSAAERDDVAHVGMGL